MAKNTIPVVAAVPSDELSLRRVEVQDAGHTVEDGLQKVLFFGQGVSGALFFGDVPGDAFDPDDLAVESRRGRALVTCQRQEPSAWRTRYVRCTWSSRPSNKSRRAFWHAGRSSG